MISIFHIGFKVRHHLFVGRLVREVLLVSDDIVFCIRAETFNNCIAQFHMVRCLLCLHAPCFKSDVYWAQVLGQRKMGNMSF